MLVLDVWTDNILHLLDASIAAPIGVFNNRGDLLYANAGMRLLLAADHADHQPADYLVNPTFQSLMQSPIQDGLIFEGPLTTGNRFDVSHTVIAKVYRKCDQLLLIGEYDVRELEHLNQQISVFNQESSNFQRDLIQELRETNLSLENEMSKRKYAEQQLRDERDHLEEVVEARTAELTKINDQLKESEERFRTMFEGSRDAIILADPPTRRFAFVNQAMCRMLGYIDDELTRKGVEDIHPEEDVPAILARFQAIASGNEPAVHDIPVKRKNGSIFYADITGHPLRIANHDYLMGIFRDVTERRKVEETVQHAKLEAEAANRAKSEFLANMSHELRTPLNGILGYTQILKQDRSFSDNQHAAIDTIHSSGEHLLMLINDILDLSKIEAGRIELEMTEFHLPTLLKPIVEIIRMRAQQKGLLFLYEEITPLPQHTMIGDQRRLRQVLLNLLNNAVKFTENGGLVLKVGSPTIESVPAEEGQRVIRFQIEDTGRGIPAEELEHIFDPFHQIRDHRFANEGTGLGLSISRRLVRQMGSELHVKSIPAYGSTFWFEIGFRESRSPEPSQEVQPPRIIGFRGERRKILIVDDKETNRAMIKTMLLPLGFEIAEAVNGQDGITQYLAWSPDLILMDLVMPEMDGFEAARRIRELETGNRNASAPLSMTVTPSKVEGSVPNIQHPASSIQHQTSIIAFSANTFEATQKRSLESGCDDFLAKPVQLETLLETIAAHLPIEWIYESSQPAAEVTETPVTLVIPSQEQLRAIFDAADLGDVSLVLQQIDELDRQSPELVGFTAPLRVFAKKFQMKQICRFLQPYLA